MQSEVLVRHFLIFFNAMLFFIHWQIFSCWHVILLLLKSFRFVPFCSFSKRLCNFFASEKRGKLIQKKVCLLCFFTTAARSLLLLHIPQRFTDDSLSRNFPHSHFLTRRCCCCCCCINWRTNNYNFPHHDFFLSST